MGRVVNWTSQISIQNAVLKPPTEHISPSCCQDHRCVPSVGRVRPECPVRTWLLAWAQPGVWIPAASGIASLLWPLKTTLKDWVLAPEQPTSGWVTKDQALSYTSRLLAHNLARPSNSNVWLLLLQTWFNHNEPKVSCEGPGMPSASNCPAHLLSTVNSRALSFVQDLHRCSVKEQQLHGEDVLLYHSLVQRCVALVVRNVNGGPMLEREAYNEKEGWKLSMQNLGGVSMGVHYKVLSIFLYVKFSLKFWGWKEYWEKNLCTKISTAAFIITAEKEQKSPKCIEQEVKQTNKNYKVHP